MTQPIVFVRKNPMGGFFHILNPSPDWFGWAPEVEKIYAQLVCGGTIEKTILRESIIHNTTNLRLCTNCKKRAVWVDGLTEAIEQAMGN